MSSLEKQWSHSFLSFLTGLGLLCRLGFCAFGFLFFDRLDHTNCHCLSHVPDGKPSQRRVLRESFYAHCLAGSHFYDGSVPGSYFFFGKSSIFLPDRLSIFSRSSVNLQAMWAV